VSKPIAITTAKPLPFNELSPLEFERLCLWLIEREGFMRPQHLGEAGGEQGRDIVAYRATGGGEELWYFQCKRHKKIGAAVLKGEVDKYVRLAASDPDKRPAGVVFAVSSTVTSRVRDEVDAYCRERGFVCEFWARNELDMRVRKYADIMTAFFYASQVLLAPALHQLPPPPRDFVGREVELGELVAARERDGATLICLRGMGGVGKTALALKLAELFAPDYPDAQLYVDLKGASPEPLSTADAMLRVVRAFSPAATLPDSEELRAQYLSALHGRRALLLMDNAAGREQVEPLIPPSGCLLLVTSRRQFHLPGAHARNIGGLAHEDARALLLKAAPRVGELGDLIAALCAGLPLLLQNAARTLAERADLSVVDYARRLEEGGERMEAVDASLGLSYELLPHELRKPWRTLAVFPDVFDAAAAAAVWGMAPEKAQDALGELVRYSLAEWDESVLRYRLHDLVRLFADTRLGEDERDVARGRHSAHYLNVLRAANYLYGRSEHPQFGLALFGLEWPNIRAGQSWAESRAGVDDEAASLCSNYPDAGAYLLHLRIHPEEQIRWREAAVCASRRLNRREEEGVHLGSLGMAYDALGETRRAIEAHEQALLISRELRDRRNEAHDLSNLGIAHVKLGELDRAVELFQEDLRICREVGHRHGEGLALGNLAAVYKSLGQFGRAAEHYEEALAITREVGERRSEGGVLSGLGVLYAEMGDWPRAFELHRQSLAIARERGDLQAEGNALGNLGWCLAYLGDLGRASECHQRQLSIARDLGDREDEGNALYGLGTVYSRQGSVGRAVVCHEQALSIIRGSGDRLNEARVIGDLGNVYARAGDFRRAIECYEQQLGIVREVGDRGGEAKALWNTGWALGALGETAQAIEYGEAGLRLFDEVGDEKNAAKARRQLTQWRQITQNGENANK
jgi:tetratricopeptide (TPR) repeat protein